MVAGPELREQRLCARWLQVRTERVRAVLRQQRLKSLPGLCFGTCVLVGRVQMRVSRHREVVGHRAFDGECVGGHQGTFQSDRTREICVALQQR